MGFERRKPVRVSGSGAHILSGIVEYHSAGPGGDDASRHHLRWVLPVVIILAIISFFCTRNFLNRAKAAKDTIIEAIGETNAPVPNQPDAERPAAPEPVKQVDTLALKQASRWHANSDTRAQADRILLERLYEAERTGNGILAADTIEKLRVRPSMADLDDPLARRLGVLNFKHLLMPTDTRWTRNVTVRRTDSLPRLAREHATSPEAIMRLNGLTNGVAPKAGTVLRIPHFLHAAFVVHLGTRTADLLLNDRFFKRYYISVSPATVPGSYAIRRGDEESHFRARFTQLGIRMTPVDLAELEIFLAPGASITVTDM